MSFIKWNENSYDINCHYHFIKSIQNVTRMLTMKSIRFGKVRKYESFHFGNRYFWKPTPLEINSDLECALHFLVRVFWSSRVNNYRIYEYWCMCHAKFASVLHQNQSLKKTGNSLFNKNTLHGNWLSLEYVVVSICSDTPATQNQKPGHILHDINSRWSDHVWKTRKKEQNNQEPMSCLYIPCTLRRNGSLNCISSSKQAIQLFEDSSRLA